MLGVSLSDCRQFAVDAWVGHEKCVGNAKKSPGLSFRSQIANWTFARNGVRWWLPQEADATSGGGEDIDGEINI
jgi:hypothetical protein